MIKLVLAGNTATAEILLAYLQNDIRYEVVGATVDDKFVADATIDGVACVGLSQLCKTFSPESCRVLMAVGYSDLNRVRESLFVRLKEMGYTIETYVHPDARVYSKLPLGEGSIVLPGTVIEPHARVGANTLVWCNVTLAHHSIIEDNCWIASGTVVAGKATVSRNSFVGVNATVVNEVCVGSYNVIGASSLISRNTKPDSIHLARSAEPLRFSSEEYVKHFGI